MYVFVAMLLDHVALSFRAIGDQFIALHSDHLTSVYLVHFVALVLPYCSRVASIINFNSRQHQIHARRYMK